MFKQIINIIERNKMSSSAHFFSRELGYKAMLWLQIGWWAATADGEQTTNPFLSRNKRAGNNWARCVYSAALLSKCAVCTWGRRWVWKLRATAVDDWHSSGPGRTHVQSWDISYIRLYVATVRALWKPLNLSVPDRVKLTNNVTMKSEKPMLKSQTTFSFRQR